MTQDVAGGTTAASLTSNGEGLSEAQETALDLLCTGKFAPAVAQLQKLKQLDGSSARAVLGAYLKGGAHSGGHGKSPAGLGRAPSLDERLSLAKALGAAREPDMAQTVLRETATAFPSSAAAHGELGLLFSGEGRYREATEELGRAVHLAPDSFEYSLGLAEALLSSKYNFTGLKFLLSVKPRFESRMEYRYILGLAYYTCYRYQPAITEFEIVAHAKPKLHRIPYLIGNCYMAQGDLKTAEAYFRKAVELRPQEATYYAALGKMLRMEGPKRLADAIQVLEQEQRLDPSDAQSKYHLALCYEAERNLNKAQDLLEQVVRQKPDMLTAHIALARIYSGNGEKDKAAREDESISRLQSNKQTNPRVTEADRPSVAPGIKR